MKTFLKNLISWPFGSRRAPQSRPSNRSRLTVESLEERMVLSTYYLVPNNAPVDATHFHSFQDAYNHAAAGDIIQIMNGASVESVGANVKGAGIGGGVKGTNTIITNSPFIGAGEWITISGGGGIWDDQALVTAVKMNPNHTFTLTLDHNLGDDHSGAGALVTTDGLLGMVKSITLEGGLVLGAVNSDFDMPKNAHDMTFNRLNFSGSHYLLFEGGAHHVHVLNSVIPFLTEQAGTGNGDNVFSGNTLQGAMINGDFTKMGNDQFTLNHFVGSSNLYVLNNNGTYIHGNTFDLTKVDPNDQLAAIVIVNSHHVGISANIIHIHNADNIADGIILQSTFGMPGWTSAFVIGNTLDTEGKGVGVMVSGKGAPMALMFQDNDFTANTIGMTLWGFGGTIGTVDLGGGALGSKGQNNFKGFTPAGTANGHFAISLHDTTHATVVMAHDNIWSTNNPAQVVKDAVRNTFKLEDLPGVYTGTGFIDLGNPIIPIGGIEVEPMTPYDHEVYMDARDPMSVLLRGDVYVDLHRVDPPPPVVGMGALDGVFAREFKTLDGLLFGDLLSEAALASLVQPGR